MANRSRSGWLWAGLELVEPPRHTCGKIEVGLGTLAGTVTLEHLPVGDCHGLGVSLTTVLGYDMMSEHLGHSDRNGYDIECD